MSTRAKPSTKRTIPTRPLSGDEIESVQTEMEVFTDEVAFNLWKGDLTESDESAINGRFDDLGRRFGGGGLIAGLLWATCELAWSIVVLEGGVDGLEENLKQIEILQVRKRLRPALRLTEAIVADAAGLDGRAMLAIEQLRNRPGFVENDLVPVLMGIWQAAIVLAARLGVGIDWFVDEDGDVVRLDEDGEDVSEDAASAKVLPLRPR